ncbi:MAG: LemA family protein [Bdellovibrionales bacterium]|nr:LemA family protein [Bdellovibrionales bacterium]
MFNKNFFSLIALLVTSSFLLGCGVQSIPKGKNEIEAQLAEVTNQYKRRSDLIPNLVEVVKGYASHEKETLQAVVEARAKATSTTIDPSKLSADQMMKFQQAQGSLSTALGKLMVVVEKYPDLKANQNFQELQSQLEGTENRITVARNRYIESIKMFNNLVTVFPTNITNNLFFHYEKMPQWDVSEGEKEKVEKAPEVKF